MALDKTVLKNLIESKITAIFAGSGVPVDFTGNPDQGIEAFADAIITHLIDSGVSGSIAPELEYLNALGIYVGAPSGSTAPNYPSTIYVTNGDAITIAVGILDNALSVVSGSVSPQDLDSVCDRGSVTDQGITVDTITASSSGSQLKDTLVNGDFQVSGNIIGNITDSTFGDIAVDTIIANNSGSILQDTAIAGLDSVDNKITNVTDPVDAQDAATKNYVDVVSGSIGSDVAANFLQAEVDTLDSVCDRGKVTNQGITVNIITAPSSGSQLSTLLVETDLQVGNDLTVGNDIIIVGNVDGVNLSVWNTALKTFTGQSNDSDSSPSYTEENFISDGDSLELAVDKLDQELNDVSGSSAAQDLDSVCDVGNVTNQNITVDYITALSSGSILQDARVNGNLQVGGNIIGNITDSTFGDITVDTITANNSGSILQALQVNEDIQANGDILADTLKSNGSIYINVDGPDGDSYLHFYDGSSPTGVHLKWSETNDRFEFSAGAYIGWALGIEENVVLNVNNADRDAVVTFNKPTSGNETLRWDKTDTRFEFSDDLYIDGTIQNTTSGSQLKDTFIDGDFQVSGNIIGNISDVTFGDITVDTVTAVNSGSSLKETSITGLDLVDNKITNVTDPTSNQDVATKKYVDDTIVTDHGDLDGLADDDHSQYHNDTRGDTRYLYKENVGAFTPDGDYEPATKKYVDDVSGSIGSDIADNFLQEEVDTLDSVCDRGDTTDQGITVDTIVALSSGSILQSLQVNEDIHAAGDIRVTNLYASLNITGDELSVGSAAIGGNCGVGNILTADSAVITNELTVGDYLDVTGTITAGTSGSSLKDTTIEGDLAVIGDIRGNNVQLIANDSHIKLSTPSNQGMYFDTGTHFYWRGTDTAGERMKLDANTGALSINGDPLASPVACQITSHEATGEAGLAVVADSDNYVALLLSNADQGKHWLFSHRKSSEDHDFQIYFYDGDWHGPHLTIETDGDTTVGGNLTAAALKSNGDIYINHDGPNGDSYLYFYDAGSPTARYLRWDVGDGEFIFSYPFKGPGLKVGAWWAADYTEIKADGEINLHGTARVINHIRVGAHSWKGGVTAPSPGYVGIFPTLDFDKTTDDSVYYNLVVPYRMAAGTTIEVEVFWTYTGGQDNGTVRWGLEYKNVAIGEVLAGGETLITKVSAGTHTTGTLVSTMLTTGIVGAVAHDSLGLRLYRDASEDTLNTDAKLVAVHFHFTEDKLGQPT